MARVRRALAARLGTDVVHAWRNRALLGSADVVWTHTEREHLAVGLVRATLPRRRRPAVLAQSVWLWGRWDALGRARRRRCAGVLRGPAVAAVLGVAAEVSQYVLAGRHMRRADVPWSTLVWGGIAGVVGFFVIPVVGLFIGFVLAVFLAELVRRRDRRAAWRATVAAMQATGITILVQLLGGLLAAATWGIGLTFTCRLPVDEAERRWMCLVPD